MGWRRHIGGDDYQSSGPKVFDLHPSGDDSLAHHRPVDFLHGTGSDMPMADAGLQKVGVDQLDGPIVFVAAVALIVGQIFAQHKFALFPGSLHPFGAFGEFEDAALEGVIMQNFRHIASKGYASKSHHNAELARCLVPHLKGVGFAARADKFQQIVF